MLNNSREKGGFCLVLFYKIRGLNSEKIPENFNCDGDFVFYFDRCITIK